YARAFCSCLSRRMHERWSGVMSTAAAQPRLVEQVYEAILSEITEGKLPPNARLIQDELAVAYGVSRQPVQQALLLLRNQGFVRDAPRRPHRRLGRRGCRPQPL